MAAAAPNTVQLAGGRLFYGVSDITIAAPYGGTELGLVSSVYVIPPLGVFRLPMEEDNSTALSVYIGGDAVAGCLLPTYDADATAALFPGAATGDAAGPIIKFPSKVGQPAETITMLLYAPTNADHNAWLMPVAQPSLDAQAQLWFSARRFLQFPVVFRSQADSDGMALVTGKLADLETIVSPPAP